MFKIQQVQRLFSKKPDIKNISEITELQPFIQKFPDDTLKPNLYKLLTDHKYYRPVNGDGNCFYRAAMFLYLRQADLANYQTLFPEADLLKCRNLPFKVSTNLTSQRLLYYLWQTQLLQLGSQSPQDRESKLLELVNRSQVIDAILIAYFRVLNYDYLLSNRNEFQPYGDIQKDLDRILNFGKESEGVEIHVLPKMLNIHIQIIMVHRQNFSIFELNKESNGTKIKLFYRPGHYDIICDQKQTQRQRKSKKKEEPPSFPLYNESNGQIRDNNQDAYIIQQIIKQTNSSRIQSVKQPSQIRQLSNSNQDTSPSSFIAPTTMKLFKQHLTNQSQNQGSRPTNKSPLQNLEYRTDKKQSPKQGLGDSTRPKDVKAKSNHLDKKQKVKNQRIMGEAVLCVVGIAALLFGVFKF